ncbi:26351_t:CDS:2 [Racocetra persica]|uniref:26351_t:CDS:1 n=1 Tax=Racocetra persica TaxID=160502 RepID=A0ACA9KC55_9GLOM|nr:26351_t:CDS:2 [Racocetra persica]
MPIAKAGDRTIYYIVSSSAFAIDSVMPKLHQYEVDYTSGLL